MENKAKLLERIGVVIFCLILLCAGILLMQTKNKPVTFLPGSENPAQTSEKTVVSDTENNSVKSAISIAPNAKVSINKASIEDLDTLPGIGPVLAQRIVDYRLSNGGFKTIEELKGVSGIGDVKYKNVKNLISL